MLRSTCLLALALSLCASEPAMTAVGVVGNTGEQGAALVRLTTDDSYRGHGNAVGCGIAMDRLGTLWTRMDDAAVTRLSLDGRQLGRFPSPASVNGLDTLAMLGDKVLLIAAGELRTLPIDAANGTAFTSTGLKLRTIGHTVVKDRLPAITADGAVVWMKADGSCEEVARMPAAWLIESDGAGNLFVGTNDAQGNMRKLVDGKEIIGGGWPKAWVVIGPGVAAIPSFLQWDNGVFFSGGSGHLAAFDGDLNPAPGTVLGMQGNTVIGIGADWRLELGAARGLVRIRDGAYAVAGALGQPFFAEWPDPTRSMHLVSWFTARAICQTLNLDADGNVYVDHLMYAWSATPDSFPVSLEGTYSSASHIARANPHLLIRQDRWNHGDTQWALPLYAGPHMERTEFIGTDKYSQAWWDRANSAQNRGRTMASVAYPDAEGYVMVCLADPTGGFTLKLFPNGRHRATGNPVAFRTSVPGKELTSLAMRDDQTLLAAIDGQVVELVRSGDDWQEQRRWNSWGGKPDDHFGKRITLACDAGRLLVADGERHRVLWFAAAGGSPKGALGTTDAAGNSLQTFDSPGLIAVCGDRAVVHDAGNQRLVKIALDK